MFNAYKAYDESLPMIAENHGEYFNNTSGRNLNLLARRNKRDSRRNKRELAQQNVDTILQEIQEIQEIIKLSQFVNSEELLEVKHTNSTKSDKDKFEVIKQNIINYFNNSEEDFIKKYSSFFNYISDHFTLENLYVLITITQLLFKNNNNKFKSAKFEFTNIKTDKIKLFLQELHNIIILTGKYKNKTDNKEENFGFDNIKELETEHFGFNNINQKEPIDSIMNSVFSLMNLTENDHNIFSTKEKIIKLVNDYGIDKIITYINDNFTLNNFYILITIVKLNLFYGTKITDHNLITKLANALNNIKDPINEIIRKLNKELEDRELTAINTKIDSKNIHPAVKVSFKKKFTNSFTNDFNKLSCDERQTEYTCVKCRKNIEVNTFYYINYGCSHLFHTVCLIEYMISHYNNHTDMIKTKVSGLLSLYHATSKNATSKITSIVKDVINFVKCPEVSCQSRYNLLGNNKDFNDIYTKLTSKKKLTIDELAKNTEVFIVEAIPLIENICKYTIKITKETLLCCVKIRPPQSTSNVIIKGGYRNKKKNKAKTIKRRKLKTNKSSKV
jgi:hypothetical protein